MAIKIVRDKIHKELVAGRWQKLSLCEQMANIGSEVSRVKNWQISFAYCARLSV